MNVVTARVANAGAHSGSKTFLYIWNKFAPSILAASIKPFGIVFICCTSKKIANGLNIDGRITLE